jgi:hypothetical protein
MKLPFMISNEDWKTLAPKKIEQLGQRKDLDPEQQQFLEIFRVVDLRVEWACERMVILNNTVVILLAVFIIYLATQSPLGLSLLVKLIP